MIKFTIGFKSLRISLLSVLVAALFLFVSNVPAYAISFPSQSDVHAAVGQVQDNVDQFIARSHQALTNTIQETRTAIRTLPDTLEAASAEVDSNYRKKVLADLQAAQQKLEKTAQDYENYVQQADALEQEMLRSAKQSRTDMRAGTRQKVEDVKTGTQQKVADVKESLKLTSDAINVLLDDTKQAINDTTSFSKARVTQHTQALQQALDTSDKALKALFN
jgi:hypothetical protein